MALNKHLYIFLTPTTTASQTAQNTYPWQRLPAELRIDILEHVLVHDKIIKVQSVGDIVVPLISDQETKALVALCNTSREMRRNVLAFFFERNDFVIPLEMKAREREGSETTVASTSLKPFHNFVDLIEPREIMKLKIHITIGTLILPNLPDLWLLKTALKTLASRKTETLRGECIISFNALTRFSFFQTPDRERVFALDAWNLRRSLTTFCDDVTRWIEEGDDRGPFRVEVARMKQVILAWAGAEWAV